MKTSRQTALILILFSLFTIMGFTSFYASGTFIVRIKQIHGKGHVDTYGRDIRKVTFKVLRHTNGQGYIMNLYKQYVGKTFTVQVACTINSPVLLPAAKVRMIYEYVSGFNRDFRTGGSRPVSSRTWKLPGKQ